MCCENNMINKFINWIIIFMIFILFIFVVLVFVNCQNDQMSKDILVAIAVNGDNTRDRYNNN